MSQQSSDTTTYAGIDYGMGNVNRDPATGIRYGVISSHCVTQFWADESEAEYVKGCPECGAEDIEDWDEDSAQSIDDALNATPYREYNTSYPQPLEYMCHHCHLAFGNDDVWSEEPVSFNLTDDEYRAFQSRDDSDIFLELSPYYVVAQYCSPCAPGAVYLANPLEWTHDEPRGYAFGYEWFESADECPYVGHLRHVDTGLLVSVPEDWMRAAETPETVAEEADDD